VRDKTIRSLHFLLIFSGNHSFACYYCKCIFLAFYLSINFLFSLLFKDLICLFHLHKIPFGNWTVTYKRVKCVKTKICPAMAVSSLTYSIWHASPPPLILLQAEPLTPLIGIMIAVSQVARIIGVNHWCQSYFILLPISSNYRENTEGMKTSFFFAFCFGHCCGPVLRLKSGWSRWLINIWLKSKWKCTCETQSYVPQMQYSALWTL
jgi:hypothetical protein